MVSDTIFLLAILAALPAFGGRPLTTEDAAILDDKACQVEAWVDRARGVSTGWLVPACNFGMGIEWQAGAARERAEGSARLSEAYAQAKGLVRDMSDESPWALGWVVGAVRRPRSETHRGWDNPYVLLPVSVKQGAFTWHAQPGWMRERESGRDLALWGVAGEFAITPAWDVVAEAFGQNSERPFVRAGLRWTPIKDHLDIDLTYVARPGGVREERVVSIGLVWYR